MIFFFLGVHWAVSIVLAVPVRPGVNAGHASASQGGKGKVGMYHSPLFWFLLVHIWVSVELGWSFRVLKSGLSLYLKLINQL